MERFLRPLPLVVTHAPSAHRIPFSPMLESSFPSASPRIIHQLWAKRCSPVYQVFRLFFLGSRDLSAFPSPFGPLLSQTSCFFSCHELRSLFDTGSPVPLGDASELRDVSFFPPLFKRFPPPLNGLSGGLRKYESSTLVQPVLLSPPTQFFFF